MPISHRLHSPMDERPGAGIEQPPGRIVFLSAEGSSTEIDYFRLVEKHKQKLSINSVIHVEVLSCWSQDTKSDPQQVYELMREYMEIRENGILPSDIYKRLAYEANDDRLMEKINGYMNNTLDPGEKKRFQNILNLAKIDYDYQKFLSNFKGTDGNDVFAIMIDRDMGSHDEVKLRELYNICEKKGLRCFITNPCFEFWLLLHVCDVEREMSGDFQKLLQNEKISNKHTYVSSVLSKRTHHSKKNITDELFIKFYIDNVDTAIERARRFETDAYALLNHLGSNIPFLFDLLREDIPST